MIVDKFCIGWSEIGIQLRADQHGWYVEREGRLLYGPGSNEGAHMFAEEMYERIRQVQRQVSDERIPKAG